MKGKTKCPNCGKEVYWNQFPDVEKIYYFDKVEPTAIELKVEKRLGIPFQHYEHHQCSKSG